MNLIINAKTSILTALLLMAAFFFPAGLFAESETGSLVFVRSSPERPVAGSTWTLTLLIAHDEPGEVDVLVPHFTGSLLLEQVVKSPRFLNSATGQFSVTNPAGAETENNAAWPPASPAVFFERWTAMEYRFVLNNSGIINFDAFTVITPRGQTKTNPFDLNVQRPQNMAEAHSYRLAWEGAPSNLKIGDNAVFALRINGWDPADLSPEASQLLPPVPPGYILESLPLRPEEKSAGVAIRLRLIPLEANPFVLERRRFSHGGNDFEIPALRIPVTAAVKGAAGNVQAGKEQAAAENIFALPFPSLEAAKKDNPGLYHKHQAECETIYHTIKNLWENGRRADALAALRHHERDHPAGALFAVLRRGAEQTLGFIGTRDEKRRFLGGLKNPLPFFREKSRSAVLRETAVRRIPDTAGEEITRFREGQPVLLDRETYPSAQKQHAIWLRVIAHDDNETSGWVPEENIIIY